jgi:ABC-type bacteriocin/lantibiotic exporter with double-glycine peptidase domain
MDFVTRSPTDYYVNLRRITQHSSMECWYVAASMVLGFRSAAKAVIAMSSNLESVIRVITNSGLNPTDVEKFSREVGLMSAMRPGNADAAWYSTFLKTNGPIWIGIHDPCAHCVVVYGVQGDNLALADPNGRNPFPRIMAVKELNQRALHVPVLYSR